MADHTAHVIVRDPEKEHQERLRSIQNYQYVSAEQSPNHAFCARCKLINFDAIFKVLETQSDSQGTAVADIGNLNRTMLTATCPCCVFCAQIVFLNKPQYPFDEVSRAYIEARSCKKDANNQDGTNQGPCGSYHKCLKLRWSGPNLGPFDNWRTGPISEHLIFPAGQKTGSAWAFGNTTAKARHIDPNTIEYGHIVDCLRQCRSSHTSCKKLDPELTVKTRLINCRTNPPNLIDGSTDMDYFALSYCWGLAQPGVTRKAYTAVGALEVALLPQTIRDAIVATHKLGCDYLWVDAICINQDDAISKQVLINKMDYLYNKADLVLVALGDDSQTGLPGISTPKFTQPALRVGGTKLVSNMSELRGLLQGSRWSSRGWTYQEALLARRCLFFTSEQWHFVCKASSAYETLVEDLPKFDDCRLDLYALRSTLFRTGATNAHDLEITEDIREYTIRDLSLDADFLNAFRGILRRSGLHSLCGVAALKPKNCRYVHQDLESGFALGLYWAAQDRHLERTAGPGPPRTTRRPGFPTWSWLSSRGVIETTWSNPQDFISNFSGIDVHASFSVLDNSGIATPLATLWQNGASGGLLDKFLELQPGQHLQITSYIVKVRFMKPTQAVMFQEYWFVLDDPLVLFPDDTCDPSTHKPSAFYSATFKIPTGEPRKIHDQESIGFDVEAFSDPGLRARILVDEFELLLLASHGYEERQVNYWIILDEENGRRKRIGTACCSGHRYTVADPSQQGKPYKSPHADHPSESPHDCIFLPKKTTITMV
ncbi:hypothetical protein Z517_00896 [Fonsecaea pedrosoi CBS 271.37]|uniref:Heterokaryon incompatibility domain-containing protein n=1 Tax=Fonsecaea pedrosoi CBS 271.37 TaxID=1442368 RepID=A0A0D2H3S6_9EURO|nr:uncharacterized protein Z517_00896 [Fonsecaea pedrosoi CBS 271.37]KIW85505.1 hypothetical protein Z517_00896 [Fonsecaea pedrosoi CBS 271.37]